MHSKIQALQLKAIRKMRVEAALNLLNNLQAEKEKQIIKIDEMKLEMLRKNSAYQMLIEKNKSEFYQGKFNGEVWTQKAQAADKIKNDNEKFAEQIEDQIQILSSIDDKIVAANSNYNKCNNLLEHSSQHYTAIINKMQLKIEEIGMEEFETKVKEKDSNLG